MKRQKKSLGIFLGAAICLLPLLFHTEIAEASQTDVSGNNEIDYGESFGYIDVPHTTYSIQDGNIGVNQGKVLPLAYDARTNQQVTAVKNQNPWGNCWSFATMAALESSMLSQGSQQNLDLSEYHLNYYNYRSVIDPLKGTEGDYVKGDGTFNQFLNNGGNVLVAYHALTNWIGAADEAFTGYHTDSAPLLEETTESAYLNDIVHLQQMYQINKADTNAIKNEIMNYGAVTASFYYNALYFNNSTGAYYNNVNTNSNHGVVLVGWDDNYSRDKFLTSPQSDGAWLVKNSWGTWFGEDGYLWVSYEDTSIQDTMCVLVGESADNYDHNYQYDGSYMNNNLVANNYITVANVFQVQDGNSKEAIKAVAFELGNTNVDYSIQIYTNLREKDDPTSGIPGLTEPVTGTAVYQGYYTVELPNEVLVNPNEPFSVVVEYNSSVRIYVTMENSTYWNNIRYVAGAKENQSFYRMRDNSPWKDAGILNNANIRIKAFTDSTDEEPDVAVSGLTVIPTELDLKAGEEVTLQANILPENAANKNIVWTSLNPDVASVSSTGNVKAIKKGETSVVCVTEDGGYEATTKIKVHNEVSLDKSETDLTVGENRQFIVLVNGIEQKVSDNRNYEWMTDNNKVVTMADDGSVRGVGMGSCKVTCRSKEDSRELATAIITIHTAFEDVRTTQWQYPYVMSIYDKKVMVGKTPEKFGTNEELSRAEFVTLLYNYTQKPTVYFEYKFSDVVDGQWYSGPVTWAAQNNITAGYGNGSFGIADCITREQFVTMLYSYAKLIGKELTKPSENLSRFTDSGMVSSWAEEAMIWATQNELLTGKPVAGGKMRIDPQGSATRAECAAIMVKYDDRP